MDKKNKNVLHHVNHTHREFDKETMKKIWQMGLARYYEVAIDEVDMENWTIKGEPMEDITINSIREVVRALKG